MSSDYQAWLQAKIDQIQASLDNTSHGSMEWVMDAYKLDILQECLRKYQLLHARAEEANS